MASFPETQWSLILRSGGTPTVRQSAFADLARDYRPAILAYFRSRLPPADAEDAVQSFLAISFEQGWWARARADAGTFRGFLLLLMRRHLGHIQGRQRDHVSFDDTSEHMDTSPDAERVFDSRFVLVLVEKSLRALRAHYKQRDREALFLELVKLTQSKPEHGGLKDAAESLGLAANTLAVEIRRLRQRLTEQMRIELEQLCSDKISFEREWAALREIIVQS